MFRILSRCIRHPSVLRNTIKPNIYPLYGLAVPRFFPRQFCDARKPGSEDDLEWAKRMDGARPVSILATDRYRFASNPDALWLQAEAYTKQLEALGLTDAVEDERDLRVCEAIP